ncbi:acyl-CoA thioesterase [Bdellovibrionota bacterium]
MKPTDFKFATTVKIRFRDCDAFGHVNNAVYFTMLEEVRTVYYKMLGLGKPNKWVRGGLGFILASAKVDYKSPAELGEELTVYLRTKRFGIKSHDIEYLIISNEENRIVGEGFTTLVGYDYSTQKSIPIPEDFKEKALKLENS